MAKLALVVTAICGSCKFKTNPEKLCTSCILCKTMDLSDTCIILSKYHNVPRFVQSACISNSALMIFY